MNSTPFPLRAAIWLWLIVALYVGKSQLLQRLPLPAVQAVLLGLSAVCLLLYFNVTGLKTWIDQLDLRALVLLHVTRFVGFYFLLLYRRGELPYAFAVPGGRGDVIVAVLALAVCVPSMTDGTRRRALAIWNVIGFVDIAMVVITAVRLGMQNNLQMRALTLPPVESAPNVSRAVDRRQSCGDLSPTSA